MSPANESGYATTAPMSTEHLRYEAVFSTILQVLRQLDTGERLILSLLYEHGLTLDEAGRVLDLNTMDVQRLYEGACDHLRAAVPTLTSSWRFLPGATHRSMLH